MYKRIVFVLLIFLCFVSCDSIFQNEEEEESLTPPSNALPVGATANELLSGEKFDKLVVEIQYAPGFAPPSGTVEDMRSFLNQHVNKPGGVEVTVNEISVPANNMYSIQEILSVENDKRTAFNSNNSMAVYLFLADGDYEGNDENGKVLGVAYQNTSMALFQKTINDLSGAVGQPSERLLTSTVLQHEIGHILGLVNVGTPMVTEHQDTNHGKHCDDTNCLMYWSVETGNFVDNLLGMSAPPELDNQCKADLAANGGK